MALDTSFNRVVAATLPLYAPRVTESIVGSIALLWKTAMMDGVETRPGGTQIVEPTILTANTTVIGSAKALIVGLKEKLDAAIAAGPAALAALSAELKAGDDALAAAVAANTPSEEVPPGPTP